MMKRWMALLLVSTMMFTLAGCSDDSETSPKEQGGDASVTSSADDVEVDATTETTFPILPTTADEPAEFVQNIETNAYEAAVYSDNTAMITKYTGNEATVKIPAAVNGYTVTSIGDWAFNGNIALQSVTVPEGVVKIGLNAISSCSNLQNIVLPSTLREIGDYAFKENTALQTVSIPDGVEIIETSAFEGCTSLKNVVIPDSVTTLKECAFEGCTGLETVVLPSGLTKLEYRVFSQCTALKSVTFPKSLVTIESSFEECTALETVVLPDGLQEIKDAAFYRCTSLKSVTIPESVTTISYSSLGYQAFEMCDNLTIYGKRGSAAETYATKAGVPFVAQ